jgi:lysophospholipase L1-like esterase
MAPQNVVFVGDSITHAIESIDINKYKHKLGAVEVYAVPADLVDDLAWRLCQAFPPAKTFVIMIGTNNTPAEDPGRKIIDVVKYIRARSRSANIVVLGIFWRSDPAARAKGQSANAAVKKFIAGAGDKRVIYSDAGVALPPTVFPDGLHPNAAGWGIVLDKITPMLARLN